MVPFPCLFDFYTHSKYSWSREKPVHQGKSENSKYRWRLGLHCFQCRIAPSACLSILIKGDCKGKRDCKSKYEISTLSLISMRQKGRQKSMTSRDLAFSTLKVTVSQGCMLYLEGSWWFPGGPSCLPASLPPGLLPSIPLFSFQYNASERLERLEWCEQSCICMHYLLDNWNPE